MIVWKRCIVISSQVAGILQLPFIKCNGELCIRDVVSMREFLVTSGYAWSVQLEITTRDGRARRIISPSGRFSGSDTDAWRPHKYFNESGND